MPLLKNNSEIQQFQNLALLAHQVVEGFISGLHKSPFHGFSAEFAEHKSYNSGESTKHIDWKLFAKTDRLYTKKYEEEMQRRLSRSSASSTPTSSAPSETDSQAGGTYMDGLSNIMPFVQLYK